jgi:serine/threonine protein kinase
MSEQDGGKYVASGTYGVVFNPPISCKPKGDNKKTKQDIGKVFLEKRGFVTEKDMMENIGKRFSKFAIPIRYACEIGAPTKADLAGIPSKMQYQVQPGMDQLVYPNGGKDLYIFSIEKGSLELQTRISWMIKIFKHMADLIHGIKTIVDNNMIHNDIKPQNMVYTPKGQKVYLIDWGLAMQRQGTYRILDKIKAYTYPYYPPEYKIATVVANKRRIPSDQDIASMMRDNMGLFSSRMNVENLFVKFGIDIMKECGLVSSFLKCYQNSLDKVFESFTNKIDVYSVGVSLMHILAELDLLDVANIKIHAIRQFVRELIHIDPHLRATPEEMIKLYDKLNTLL